MKMLIPNWTNKGFPADWFNEMNSFFDSASRTSPLQAYSDQAFDPACDIAETDEHYALSFDLPGLKKDEIKIELDNNVLSVSGERKREFVSDKNERVQRFERSYGFFKRSFNLPSTVDAEKVVAKYEDGVLSLTIPKSQAAKPRQISIQSR
jgi:HSP20 family protein